MYVVLVPLPVFDKMHIFIDKKIIVKKISTLN